MKKTGIKGYTTTLLLIMICGLIGFTYLQNYSKKSDDEAKKPENEILLEYDFDTKYPKTVRETVKLHCRYLKSAYSGEFGAEDLRKVNQNIRKLFDEELLLLNSEEQQLLAFKQEIASFEKNKKKIVNYSLAEASQTKNNTVNGVEYAKTKVRMTMKVETETVSGDVEYILRKDSEGKWKILGWQAVKDTSKEVSEGE